ncbi:hypothetical protein [Mucilaginibacter auburnensis]|uniref:Uncharacterized protein n=1 Tax=Mucilaginibacter auburnensis TaxID=1457233 RepID=A0A2H9VPZ3_9SPHI|nr:hypothetical protein [Mucilaginibacter auburnensis]PJJ80360.1 hypothetical protein CLV57_3510 [Mucilaginibacter auburnensis]
MPKSLVYFLFVFSLILSSSSIAATTYQQSLIDTTISLIIKGRIEINPKPAFIEIQENNGQLNIAYTVVSNINFADMLADSAYQNSYRKYKQGKANIWPSKSFYKKYGNFATDVLSTKDKGLTDLLAQLHASNVQEIERNNENAQRHLLDGANFYLIETTPTGTRQIQAESPDEKSHPLLYKILAKCREIYRSAHPDNTGFW